MTENRVVIYSNGIADFQRHYEVAADEAQRISIPVRQDHLADVLASFNVYGNVRLESPPTFRPSNELEGNISIDPKRVLEDLAANLSGAAVHIERPGGQLQGTLVGLHQEEESTGGDAIHPKSIIVLSEDGLRRCAVRDIQSLKFIDDDVQKEIDKALQRNYQRIKPNSTFVEMVLSAQDDQADAVVQYTIPAAAWKVSYRLRVTEGKPAELQGFAIVDNNTDEDWTGFRVCVVTGEPITFSTDLAESKSPSRSHMNMVSETALGAVEVAAAMMEPEEEIGMFGGGPPAPGARAMMRKMGRMRSAREETAEYGQHDLMDRGVAEVASAEVHEVGDFNIFESESLVDIPAKRSTVIPVFNVETPDAKPVLHYRYENHATRPYRSIEFTNTTEFSLGRGVCTVFEEAAYSGTCVIPSLKPDENRLLPHALETGVSVELDRKRGRDKVVALRLSEGTCWTSVRQRRETHYHIKSSARESSQLVLDHDWVLHEPELAATLVQAGKSESLEVDSRLPTGPRFRLTLDPKAELVIKVVEQRTEESKMELVSVTKKHEELRIDWIERTLVKSNGPLAQDPGIQETLAIHAELEAKRAEITAAVNETERLATRQDRLRQNIKAGGKDDLTDRWRSDLNVAEEAIQQIEEEKIPALREEEKALRARLRTALESLSAEWSVG